MINLDMLVRYIPFILGYVAAYIIKKKTQYKKLDDMYFYSMLAGLIGARIIYAIVDVGIFDYDWSKVYMVNQYNLNTIGGLVLALTTFYILSKKYEADPKDLMPFAYVLLNLVFILSYTVELYLMKTSVFYLSLTSEFSLIVKALALVAITLVVMKSNKQFKPVVLLILFSVFHLVIYLI